MKEQQKEWKMWQEIYNNLVTDHTDARHKHRFCVQFDSIVDDAIEYITNQSPIGRYPGKSRIVAIIYAKCLEEVYGEDFYEVLNDPDLLHNQDEFFVPYLNDMETYDEIIQRLESIPDWMQGGWAPKTIEYFHLECTEEGIKKINGNPIASES